MGFMTSLKLSGAIAAGVLALGLCAPANASQVTFDVVYTGSSRFNDNVANLLVTATDLGFAVTPAGRTGTYEVWDIDTIIGTRTTTVRANGHTDVQTVTGVSDGDPYYDVSDVIYVDVLTGLPALDALGIAFNTDIGNIYNLAYAPGFSATYPYAESVNGGDDAGVNVTIKQVPTPTALALLGASLMGIGLIRRRKVV